MTHICAHHIGHRSCNNDRYAPVEYQRIAFYADANSVVPPRVARIIRRNVRLAPDDPPPDQRHRLKERVRDQLTRRAVQDEVRLVAVPELRRRHPLRRELRGERKLRDQDEDADCETTSIGSMEH